MNHRFGASERIKSRRLTSALFHSGSTFSIRPFRVTWLFDQGLPAGPVSVLISIPKSRVRKATDRNLIRRRIREAYRLNKSILSGTHMSGATGRLMVAFTYTSVTLENFQTIREKIILILHRLTEADEKVTG